MFLMFQMIALDVSYGFGRYRSMFLIIVFLIKKACILVVHLMFNSPSLSFSSNIALLYVYCLGPGLIVGTAGTFKYSNSLCEKTVLIIFETFPAFPAFPALHTHKPTYEHTLRKTHSCRHIRTHTFIQTHTHTHTHTHTQRDTH